VIIKLKMMIMSLKVNYKCNPVECAIVSCRFLHDVVWSIMRTEVVGFSTSVGSFGSFSLN